MPKRQLMRIEAQKLLILSIQSKYLLQPCLTTTLRPASSTPTLNFSHRASCPAPITRSVSSSSHPINPFVGRPPGTPGIPALRVADLDCGPHPSGSSPISNRVAADE